MQLILTTELLLEAYRQGMFPMAYNAGSPYIHWVCPDMRGQLSITDMHIPRRLKKTVMQELFDVRIDTAFEEVIRLCAEPADDRPDTWINEPIRTAYLELHEKGHAHSIECWDEGELVGGVYGLAIGGAFFGESMFSRTTDASKVALVHAVARLWRGGFSLLDTQFVNDHLLQFGVYEIPHDEYVELLKPAVELTGDFVQGGVSEATLLNEYFEMRALQKL